MIKLSHIINPVDSTESAELFVVQQTTFKSMLLAKSNAILADVELCSIKKSAQNDFIPPVFKQLPSLARDIREVVNGTKKSYPILSDILKAHAQFSSADYLIYTNLDITLMPYFYDSVAAYIQQGHDAIIINRRSIDNKYATETNLQIMFAEVGKIHTGYDCFIVKKSLYNKFIFKDICLGVPGVGNDLFYNIFTFAENPILLTQKHLTFHIGFELYKNWGDNATRAHNESEFNKLLQELEPSMVADKFPGADLGLLKRHFKWLMNPTFSYPLMFKLDRKRNFKRTVKPNQNTFVADRKQRYLEWMIEYVNFKD